MTNSQVLLLIVLLTAPNSIGVVGGSSENKTTNTQPHTGTTDSEMPSKTLTTAGGPTHPIPTSPIGPTAPYSLDQSKSSESASGPTPSSIATENPIHTDQDANADFVNTSTHIPTTEEDEDDINDDVPPSGSYDKVTTEDQSPDDVTTNNQSTLHLTTPEYEKTTIQPVMKTITVNWTSTNDSITIDYSTTQPASAKTPFELTFWLNSSLKGSTQIATGTVAFKNLSSSTFFSLEVRDNQNSTYLLNSSDSSNKTIQMSTQPNPPRSIKCIRSTNIEMILSIEGDDNVNYTVSTAKMSEHSGIEIKPINSTYYAVNKIQKNETYSLDIITSFWYQTSQPTTFNCTPIAKVPSQVVHLAPKSTSADSVTVTWEKPSNTYGDITKYLIYVHHQNQTVVRNETLSTGFIYTYKDGNRAGVNITFEVAAVNDEGIGESNSVSVIPPVTAPHLKKGALKVFSKTSTNAVIIIHNPFTDRYGPIHNYSLIISDKPNSGCNGDKYYHPNMPYYIVYQCHDLFKELTNEKTCGRTPYEVNDRRHKKEGQSVFLNIGDDKSCTSEENKFCDGPIKPNSTVYLNIEACNEGGCTCYQYKESIQTDSVSYSEKANSSVAAIAATLSVIIIILLCVLVVIILHRKNLLQKYFPRHLRAHQEMSLKKVPSHRPVPTTKPIPIANFVKNLDELARDSGLRFSEEYEDLRNVGRNQSSENSELQCNRSKNRFANILPYDQTRVKLLPTEDDDGSDYINANWIPGYHSKREYIATQGPLPATNDDFWRMTWECNAPAIVMLTLCVEKSRPRCDMYWPPDRESILFADIEVSLLDETICNEWHIREFQMKHGSQIKTIKHFHYLEWPDMNVPKIESLLTFIALVREKLGTPPLTGPIVVHCSAGVGRTGTFIAMDTILEQLKSDTNPEQLIDIYGIVYRMRQCRYLMVQTEQQYIFIYECTKHVLEKPDRPLSYKDLPKNRNSNHINMTTPADDVMDTNSCVVLIEDSGVDQGQDNESLATDAAAAPGDQAEESTCTIVQIEENETDGEEIDDDEGIGIVGKDSGEQPSSNRQSFATTNF